jgi:hypothetical protein
MKTLKFLKLFENFIILKTYEICKFWNFMKIQNFFFKNWNFKKFLKLKKNNWTFNLFLLNFIILKILKFYEIF